MTPRQEQAAREFARRFDRLAREAGCMPPVAAIRGLLSACSLPGDLDLCGQCGGTGLAGPMFPEDGMPVPKCWSCDGLGAVAS